jgi:hypothetical protein
MRIVSVLAAFAVSAAAFMDPVSAATVEIAPENPAHVFNGNVSTLYNWQPGLLFNVQDGLPVTPKLNSIGVYLGETVSRANPIDLTLSLHTMQSGNIRDTIFVGREEITHGAGWIDFDLGGMDLPRSYIGDERTTYMIRLYAPVTSTLVGRQYLTSSSTNAATWWFDQDPLEFIYGYRNDNRQVTRYLPGLRFEFDTPAVPLPAGLPLLLTAFGATALLRRRKA